MLALLHIPSGTLIRFHYSTLKDPIVDLEFAYKFEYYRKAMAYPFKSWLEKIQAKIVSESLVNMEQFYKLNPSLRGQDVFMSEFTVVEIKEQMKNQPEMDLHGLAITPFEDQSHGVTK